MEKSENNLNKAGLNRTFNQELNFDCRTMPYFRESPLQLSSLPLSDSFSKCIMISHAKGRVSTPID